MTEYMTEQEQIEQLKGWVKQYGLTVLSGVILALIFVSGWHSFQNYQHNKLIHASAVYDEMLMQRAQNRPQEMVVQANKLLDHYPKTAYAQIAALMLARNDMVTNDYAHAFMHLKWVFDHTRTRSLLQITKIRMARVLIEEKLPQDALDLLAKVLDPSFNSMTDEVRGDAYLALQKPADARAAYKLALSSIPDDDTASRPILQMKFDELATA